MKLLTIIDRLKSEATTLSGRVAGTAEFEAEIERTDMALPCAFVLLVGETASESVEQMAVQQVVEETYGAIVCVSNAADPRGQAAKESLDDIRTDLLAALLGWEADGDHAAMEYRGSRQLYQDRAKLIHQFNFATLTVIRQP